MKIEKTEDEILIRVPASTDLIGLQKIWDYVRFRELASKSKARQEQIDELANESKVNWWDENGDKLGK